MATPFFVIAQAAGCKVQELTLDQSSAPGATAPAFSPDRHLVVFGKAVGSRTFLFQSDRRANLWGSPHLAGFSGVYTDIEPAFSSDGRHIIFTSNRPLVGGGARLDGNYDGKVRVGHGGQLWKVNRTSRGWSEPVLLPDEVNEGGSVFSPAIQGDGTLYFMRPVNAGDKFHLYRSPFVEGHYSNLQRLNFSNLEAYGDFDPAVSKAGSFFLLVPSASVSPASLGPTYRLPYAGRLVRSCGPAFVDLRRRLWCRSRLFSG